MFVIENYMHTERRHTKDMVCLKQRNIDRKQHMESYIYDHGLRMTCSVLKEDPNVYKVKKTAVHYDETHHNNTRKLLHQKQLSILHLISI